ncbi:MAG: adenine phosphoribosyltransferase [Thermomicrobiales bacterium]
MPNSEPMSLEQIKSLIRDVPDFPQPGILFRDITPMLAHGEALHTAASLLASPFDSIDLVVAIESRGFILGAPVALELGAGLVPVRKPGKLPYKTISESYALEYGTNTLEMHIDAIKPGQRVLIVDDLLATGGTVGAAIKLVEELGGEIAGISVLAELTFLHGRETVRPHGVHSLISF